MDQITAKMDAQFLPCPEGSQLAVAVDVIDLGDKVEQYQNNPPHLSHKIAIVFQADEENDSTGKRYEPSIELTLSFGQKAKLRKFLADWRGKPYTDGEALAGIPLHKLAGQNAIINVQHKTSGQGRVYAVIASIAPPMRNMPKIVPHNYTRSEHWAKRKAEYAEGVDRYRNAPPADEAQRESQQQPAGVPVPAERIEMAAKPKPAPVPAGANPGYDLSPNAPARFAHLPAALAPDGDDFDDLPF